MKKDILPKSKKAVTKNSIDISIKRAYITVIMPKLTDSYSLVAIKEEPAAFRPIPGPQTHNQERARQSINIQSFLPFSCSFAI